MKPTLLAAVLLAPVAALCGGRSEVNTDGNAPIVGAIRRDAWDVARSVPAMAANLELANNPATSEPGMFAAGEIRSEAAAKGMTLGGEGTANRVVISLENHGTLLSLWSLHPFPSLVKVPEFPEVALNDVWRTKAELDDTFSFAGNDIVRPAMLADHEVVKLS